jgi:hypothetical protein
VAYKGQKLDRDERRRMLLRTAQTHATEKFNIGGRPKKRQPRPVTLPKLKCLEGESK